MMVVPELFVLYERAEDNSLENILTCYVFTPEFRNKILGKHQGEKNSIMKLLSFSVNTQRRLDVP